MPRCAAHPLPPRPSCRSSELTSIVTGGGGGGKGGGSLSRKGSDGDTAPLVRQR